jgi:hypothetical protein
MQNLSNHHPCKRRERRRHASAVDCGHGHQHVDAGGGETVANAWRKYYEGERAPFSWAPEQVEVVESGTLAYSGGPVYDASGKRVGRFNSIWRLEAPDRWKIVFDRGAQPCQCEARAAK